jgi:hypothetical protein
VVTKLASELTFVYEDFCSNRHREDGHSSVSNRLRAVRFEVFTAVTMKNADVSDEV